MRYAVSACLMGVDCKYNGGNNACQELIEFLKDKEPLLVCPEVTGGLPTPRACSEIVGDRVLNTAGEDVTKAFVKGAELELAKMRAKQIDVVILQPRSPSCGYGEIYDGSFTGCLTEGDGIFAKMCKKQGLTVWNCMEFIEKAKEILK